MADVGMPHINYLLRLWQSGAEEPVWRASLENPSTGERHAFATLEALHRFLKAESAATTVREGDVEGGPEVESGPRDEPA